MAGIGPYLKRIPNRSGIYFQRAVPRPLQKKLGKKTWQFKAGDTVQQARRAVNDFLVQTDAEIARATGAINEGLLKSIDEVPAYGIQQDLEEQGLTPEDLYPRHSPEDAHRLVERQANREAGLPYADRTWQDLLKLCIRLKEPAPSTEAEWKRRVEELHKITGQPDPTKITPDDARRYRDHQLDTVANTTLKTRVRYLRAMYEVAMAEEWIDSNPFDVIKLRFIKGTSKKKEVIRLDEIDKKVRDGSIPSYQQTLYWIMRFTGTHVSEAAGIQYRDIDLINGVINIHANELRPLKNQYREREIPMLDELKEVLSSIDITGHKPNTYVFPGLYDDRYQRWANGMSWDRRLGVSPKACRDCVATTLRDADVNERVLGSILGHTPKNSTGLYGSVTMDAKLKALKNLTS